MILNFKFYKNYKDVSRSLTDTLKCIINIFNVACVSLVLMRYQRIMSLEITGDYLTQLQIYCIFYMLANESVKKIILNYVHYYFLLLNRENLLANESGKK